MHTLRSISSALFAVVLAVAIFSVAPFAHAQFDGSGDYSGGCCGGSYSTGVDYSYPADYGSYSLGTDYTYPASSGSYSLGTDFYTSGYSTGYLGGGFVGGGYLGGGYLGGGYGGGYNSSSVYAPTNTWDNGNTNIYAPTQTNTCTAGNSCNSSTNIVTNTTNPAPIVYNTPTYAPPPVYNYGYNTQTCNTCGCLGYPVCNTVAYNPTPYVTLSQVPYTGLDLGFWGTIAYWSFLVLWALAAAYLIVVKRVQNRIFRAMKSFLFGSTDATERRSATAQQAARSEGASALQTSASVLDINALAMQIAAILEPRVATSNGAPVAPRGDYVDSFVMSQVNRKRS